MSALVEHKFGYTTLKVTEGGRLDALCKELKEEFPKLRMQEKRRHWRWRFLNVLLLIITFGGNRGFIEKFTTTIRRTIAWSDGKWKLIIDRPDGWEDRVWSTLMHEREHLRQFKRYGTIIMSALYILAYLPMGLAWFRAKFEKAGYLQTLRCWYVLDLAWARGEKTNSDGQTAKEWWIKQFTGPNYAWAWPFKGQVAAWYDQELSMLEAEA